MKEFSGRLREIDNYDVFKNTIIDINKLFRKVFGDEIIDKYDLFIDNATAGSGYTPVCVVVLQKYILIKLHIKDFSDKARIMYQYSHELTHYVFYALNGLDKKLGLEIEENIASAMSLVVLKYFNSDEFESYNEYVKNLDDAKYQKGFDVACDVHYDIYKLRDMILKVCKRDD
ncbi:MAG: hypothetical protein IJ093_04155 [Bacilli bacterium]|nr:hypothetical protein [Bacilli bacterium]